MKFIFLAAMMAPAQTAFAVRAPSTSELDDIQRQMFTANQMDSKVKAADIALTLARQNGRPPEEISRDKRQLELEKAKQDAARTKAIHMAILAYELDPPSKNGISVLTRTAGRSISWMPVAHDPAARIIQSAKGGFTEIEQPKDEYAGRTYPDGVTYMDPSAFTHGPGYLASYLLHERTHFEQMTTLGKGDKMSYAELQREAYKAQVDNQLFFFSDNRPGDKTLMGQIGDLYNTENALANQEKKDRETMVGKIRGLIPHVQLDVFDSKVHTNAELADISGLVAQARSQAEISRRDREERENNERIEREHQRFVDAIQQQQRDLERARAAESIGRAAENAPDGFIPAQPVRTVELSSVLPRLKDLAAAACRAPEQAVLESYLHDNYSRYYDESAAQGLAAGLDDCSRRLFHQLIEALRLGRGDSIDRQWVTSVVAANTPAQPSGGYSGGRRGDGGGERTVPRTPDHDPVRGKVGKVIQLR